MDYRIRKTQDNENKGVIVPPCIKVYPAGQHQSISYILLATCPLIAFSLKPWASTAEKCFWKLHHLFSEQTSFSNHM